jgi:hypothetical protein
VDRSLIVSRHIHELFEMRNVLTAEISNQLGPRLSAVVTYSEAARVSSLEEAMMDGPDPVYGSNLQHGLLTARHISRIATSDRILLVTYSLPSAHHISGQAFFMEPPIDQSLDAARSEALSAASDGLRMDIVTVAPNGDTARSAALAAFFVPLVEATGGSTESVAAGQDVAPIVSGIIPSDGYPPIP